MIYLLIPLCALLYWIGGEKWAHTLFRDLGCTICIIGLSTFIFGWHWIYILSAGAIWGGLAVGDHDGYYWAIHGAIVGVALGVLYPLAGLITSVICAGSTYAISRYANRYGIDVWCRGLIYGASPLMVSWLL